MSSAAGACSFALRHTSASSSSKCCSQPPFLPCSLRIAPSRGKKAMTIPARGGGNSCARRVVLAMGFAVIRLLKMRAHAIDALAAESTALTAPDLNQNIEILAQGHSSGHPFFSILNLLGILGAGVLAALFVSKKKEKAISDATVEHMKNLLKEKDAAITSLEKKFEEELINEKEFLNKELGRVKAEHQSLVNQLAMATDTISNLGQELQKEQNIVKELAIEVDDLEHCIQNAGDEKRQLQQQLKEKLDSVGALQERMGLLSLDIKDKEDTIQHLSCSLADKNRELDQLSSVYQQCEDHLISLESENKQLKDVLLRNQKELELKYEMVHELDAELNTLKAEKDESNKKLAAILMEYNNFKSSMEKKSTSDAKLLRQREGKIHLLDEQLKSSLDDKKKDEVLIAALTQERDDLKEMLNIELKNMKILEKELRITQATLEKSRYETSDLAKQLQESRSLCSELEDEVCKVQAEFREARESLHRKLEKAKQGAEILSKEVSSANDLFRKSREELQIMSTELAASLQKCNSLEEELIDALRKVESATVDLNEEKKIVSTLNKELMHLETQILRDKEARKSLESELEEATKFLNDVNQNALMLSRELELAHSQISSVEDEKEKLYKFIAVQKQASQESQVHLEDAHNLVMKLGKERESLTNRGKKLEEELASAKGEILRLMSQINSSKTAGDVQHVQKVDMGGKAAASGRRNTQRRRKAKPQQKDS
ncbi:MAR-binding filament-like protein 1-1 [Salvia miltiorrhiza]|uniref:MAR-binding filament-like protein 1-1 n=1 Tax=Salvia miltiorrhiza TaxID=226208 RepID=UPI0025AB753F|nr:MAR-binding filament-like protein 1-1 [Salvia miltiorrhiza]